MRLIFVYDISFCESQFKVAKVTLKDVETNKFKIINIDLPPKAFTHGKLTDEAVFLLSHEIYNEAFLEYGENNLTIDFIEAKLRAF